MHVHTEHIGNTYMCPYIPKLNRWRWRFSTDGPPYKKKGSIYINVCKHKKI